MLRGSTSRVNESSCGVTGCGSSIHASLFPSGVSSNTPSTRLSSMSGWALGHINGFMPRLPDDFLDWFHDEADGGDAAGRDDFRSQFGVGNRSLDLLCYAACEPIRVDFLRERSLDLTTNDRTARQFSTGACFDGFIDDVAEVSELDGFCSRCHSFAFSFDKN